MKQLSLLLCLFAWSSQAATYFVSTSGNDGTGTGSFGAPWRTVQKSANTVAAGDIVYVLSGTYEEQVTVPTSGTSSSAMIWFVSTNGAVIRGFSLSSKNWIGIKGFEITYPFATSNYAAAILIDGCNRCRIQDNYIHDTLGYGIRMFPTLSGFNTVRSNYFYHIGYSDTNKSGSTCVFVSGNTNIVDYNRMAYLDDYVEVEGTNNFVRNNWMDITDTNTFPDNVDGGGPHSDLITTFDSSTVPTNLWLLFERNFSVSNSCPNGHGAIFQAQGTRSNSALKGFVYRQNVIAFGGSYSVINDGASVFSYYNNTLYTNGFNGGGQDRDVALNTATNAMVRNNIFLDEFPGAGWTPIGLAGLTNNYDGDYDLAYNRVTGTVSFTPGEAHSMSVDPLLTDPRNFGFRLQSGSSARNAAGFLTGATASGSSSTTLTVTNSQAFFGALGDYEGDRIIIGGTMARISSISGNTITLANPTTWSAGDSVWIYGGRDIGAIPYNANGYEPTISCSYAGSLHTALVNDTNLVRGVEFIEDNIPKTFVVDPPYTYTSSGGTVVARAYNAWASTNLAVSVTSQASAANRIGIIPRIRGIRRQ